MASIERVLITGAAGRIGRELPEFIRGEWDLRLTDREPVETDLAFFPARLDHFEEVLRVSDGMDAIVHLAATPWEYDFEREMVPANIVGVRNIYEAAVRNGLQRVVFASTFHVIGFHHVDGTREVPEEAAYRPDLMYSATKVFGETLGRLYWDRDRLSVVCLRIGFYHVGGKAQRCYDTARQGLMLTPRDFGQLVARSLRHPDLGYEIFNAISESPAPWVSIEKARRVLSYEPQDSVASVYGADAVPKPETSSDWDWIHRTQEKYRPAPV